MKSQLTFLLLTYFKLNEMAILSKGCKPDNFESHTFLKLSFINIQGLFEFCWMCIFPWIKLFWHSCFMWHKFGWIKWFWQFLCEGLSFFNLKGFYYSYTWPCSLFEGRTSFCTGLISRKLCRFLLMFLTCINSLSILLLFPLATTFLIFDAISSNIDEVLSIKPSDHQPFHMKW